MKSHKKQTKMILGMALLGLTLTASAVLGQNRDNRPQEQPAQLSGYINLHTANGIFVTPEWWNTSGITTNDKGKAGKPAGATEPLISNPEDQKNSESVLFTYEWRAPDAEKIRQSDEATGNSAVLFNRDQKPQRRPISPFPEKASPGMFPGSRLRGPFEQVYPRPFYAGGQP